MPYALASFWIHLINFVKDVVALLRVLSICVCPVDLKDEKGTFFRGTPVWNYKKAFKASAKSVGIHRLQGNSKPDAQGVTALKSSSLTLLPGSSSGGDPVTSTRSLSWDEQSHIIPSHDNILTSSFSTRDAFIPPVNSVHCFSSMHMIASMCKSKRTTPLERSTSPRPVTGCFCLTSTTVPPFRITCLHLYQENEHPRGI